MGQTLGERKAFTLIELIIILALIAAMSFLLFPAFKPYQVFAILKKNVWTLTSDLRACRQQAIIEHKYYAFAFNTANESYTITKSDYPGGSNPVTIKTENLSINIVSATDFSFEPEGNTNNASTIVLRNATGDTTTITIAPTTGNIKLQ